MRYINVEPLLERIIKLEAEALEQARKYATTEDSVRWNRWAAILGERTAFKYDLIDAPTVDAEPVVRCKDCKFYRKTNATTIDYLDYIKGNTENKKPVYMCDKDVIDWATPEDYCSYGERKENE